MNDAVRGQSAKQFKSRLRDPAQNLGQRQPTSSKSNLTLRYTVKKQMLLVKKKAGSLLFPSNI
jgi:hypothetical protein